MIDFNDKYIFKDKLISTKNIKSTNLRLYIPIEWVERSKTNHESRIEKIVVQKKYGTHITFWHFNHLKKNNYKKPIKPKIT